MLSYKYVIHKYMEFSPSFAKFAFFGCVVGYQIMPKNKKIHNFNQNY